MGEFENALRAEMEGRRKNLVMINRQLWHDAMSRVTLPPQTPWRRFLGRLRTSKLLVKGYLSTLWRALKGEAIYDSYDY